MNDPVGTGCGAPSSCAKFVYQDVFDSSSNNSSAHTKCFDEDARKSLAYPDALAERDVRASISPGRLNFEKPRKYYFCFL